MIEWVEGLYNLGRLYSSIGYCTSVAVESCPMGAQAGVRRIEAGSLGAGSAGVKCPHHFRSRSERPGL